jgi:rubredoxin
LQLLFENQKLLLKRLLLAPAPVHCGENKDGKYIVGTNIEWNVTKRVDSACDTVTGQEIDLEKELFPDVVKVYCPDMEDRPDYSLEDLDVKWCIPVCGTTRDVLMSIYALYQLLSKHHKGRLVFKGFREREIKEGADYKEYSLDLGRRYRRFADLPTISSINPRSIS